MTDEERYRNALKKLELVEEMLHRWAEWHPDEELTLEDRPDKDSFSGCDSPYTVAGSRRMLRAFRDIDRGTYVDGQDDD